MESPRTHMEQHEEGEWFHVASRVGPSLIFWSFCLSLIALGVVQTLSRRTEVQPPRAPGTLARPQPLTPPPPALLSERHLGGANFRVTYPAGVAEGDAGFVLNALEEARADMSRRLSAAQLRPPGLPTIEVAIHASTGNFTAATGQPAWSAAVTLGARVELQPVEVLRRRGVLVQTLRHEYAHAVIEALGKGRAPRWLAEGLAAHFAGEGPALARHEPQAELTGAEIERGLSLSSSPQEMRLLYAAAYHKVLALIRAQGEPQAWKRLTI